MREIKFRVFDDSVGKMIEWEELWKDKGRYYGVQSVFDGDNHHYHLMQYTGLNDKNGKMIYEGDILRWDDGYAGTWAVWWNNMFDHSTWHSTHGKVEIIGNVHENPELLEKAV